MWFHKEEQGSEASPSVKCDKIRLIVGIIVVIVLFIIALYAERNLVTGITALIAGIIIGMFMAEKCAMKRCKQ